MLWFSFQLTVALFIKLISYGQTEEHQHRSAPLDYPLWKNIDLLHMCSNSSTVMEIGLRSLTICFKIVFKTVDSFFKSEHKICFFIQRKKSKSYALWLMKYLLNNVKEPMILYLYDFVFASWLKIALLVNMKIYEIMFHTI